MRLNFISHTYGLVEVKGNKNEIPNSVDFKTSKIRFLETDLGKNKSKSLG